MNSPAALAGAGVARRPPALAVERDELHLWTLRQPWTDGGARAMLTSELDDAERTRAASFLRPYDRLLYVASHIALRRVLAAYVGSDPAELVLARAACPECGGPHGRPYVAATPPAPVHFSLSHSHGLALIGVSAAPVGVDVERIPTAETSELCLPTLHPAERSELSELPASEQPMAFGRLWTRKEAYLKGIGTGLKRDLAADYLGGRSNPADPRRPPGWIVSNVPGYPSHVAAVAVQAGTDQRMTARRVPMESLYTKDAERGVELIASAKEHLSTVLPAGPDARA
ncbi:4'-phosphopantetheinyl transferase superfamily protein [Streptomyces sp. Je 1-332]|uniref:4'-phosphopantetheinyl transferase family protein n=1 Tax=Streptomyces sp. Je 1-332 TaxID=3231270 RepID=UPI0034585A5B